MKFAKFTDKNNEVHKGIVTATDIKEITGNIFEDWYYTGEVFSKEEVKLVAPIRPNQVIGIGANFVAQKEELPQTLPEIPVFFLKPVSSVQKKTLLYQQILIR